jgi:hypothetical protein
VEKSYSKIVEKSPLIPTPLNVIWFALIGIIVTLETPIPHDGVLKNVPSTGKDDVRADVHTEPIQY